MLAGWCDCYPIISIEDGTAEGEWEGWKKLTDALGARPVGVGDDLFVTNPAILKEGIEKGRRQLDPHQVNQIGMLTETSRDQWRSAGYTAVVSHRSGEWKTARSRISRGAGTPVRSRRVR